MSTLRTTPARSTVHAQFENLSDTRHAVERLLNNGVPPRAITAEVSNLPTDAPSDEPATEQVRVVGWPARAGASGALLGALVGTVVVAAAADGLLGPVLTEMTTSLGLLRVAVGMSMMGLALGGVSGFVRSRARLDVHRRSDVDHVDLTVSTRTAVRARRALAALEGSMATDVHMAEPTHAIG